MTAGKERKDHARQGKARQGKARRLTLLLGVSAAFLFLRPPAVSAGENVVSPYLTPLQTGPDVASDGSGRYVMAWSAWSPYGGLTDLSGRFFLNPAVPWHNEFQINSLNLSLNHSYNPQIAITETGQVGIAWTTGNFDQYDPSLDYIDSVTGFARFFSLYSGQPHPGQVDLGTIHVHEELGRPGVHPQICASDTGFVLAWVEGGIMGSNSATLFAQRFSDSGQPVDQPLELDYGCPGSPFAMDCFPDGSFAVVWPYDNPLNTDPQIGDVKLQKVDSTFHPVWLTPAELSGVTQYALTTTSDGGIQLAYRTTSYDQSIWIMPFPDNYVPGVHPEPLPVLVRDATIDPDWSLNVFDIGASPSRTIVAWIEQRTANERRIRAARFDTTSNWLKLLWDDDDLQGFEPILSVTYPDVTPRLLGAQPTVHQPYVDPLVISVSDPTTPGGGFVVTWSAVTDLARVHPSQPGINVVMRWFNRFGVTLPAGPDRDGDGILNEHDCDPLNRFLRYDIDQDLICDEITGGTEEDCEDECNLVYGPSSAVKCIERCRNLDNCPCLAPSPACPNDLSRFAGQTAYTANCQPYKDCIDTEMSYWNSNASYPDNLDQHCDTDPTVAAQRQICHDYFANPNQEDGNGNNRGDRCESHLQENIVRFRPAGNQYLNGPGSLGLPLGVCVGETYDVEVELEGGYLDWVGTPTPGWYGQSQRVKVGACGCVDPLDPACGTYKCPEDIERDNNGYLVWEAIQAEQSKLKPNVGDPGACQYPTCERWLYSDEPTAKYWIPNDPGGNQKARAFAINKHQLFTHDPALNRHLYDWDWRSYEKESLQGKYARVQVVWQDPTLTSYTYHDPLDLRTAYSNGWELMETACGARYRPLNVGIDKPEYYERPHPCGPDAFRAEPYPYALKPGTAEGEMTLVSYAAGLRTEVIEPVTYTEGSESVMNEADPGTAAACLDTSRLGQDLGRADVLFRFGGTDPQGGFSNALWLGFPTHAENRWLRAEEIYGDQAGQGPVMEFPRLIHDARNQRLIALGHVRVPMNGQVQILVNRLWTFDLETGQWADAGMLPIPQSWVTFFSVSLDSLKNRALLVDGVYQGGWQGTAVYSLDLDTLKLTEITTTPTDQGPFGLHDPGAFLEPLEQALYIYGGTDTSGASTKAFRLDLRTNTWTYLGDGAAGPGERWRPFVSYDRISKTLWVSGGYGAGWVPEIVFWGLRDGEWFKKETLKRTDIDDWEADGTFDAYTPNKFLVQVEDTDPYPGRLLVAHLESLDPSLGLEVWDSQGNLVGSDLSAGTDNYVSFYAHSMYIVRVVAGPGLDSTQHPTFRVEVRDAVLTEVSEYTSSQGVNDVLLQGNVAFLVGTGGMDAVSLSDPAAPQLLGHLDLGGNGQDIELCGHAACVAKTRQGASLSTIDVSDPSAMQAIGELQTPGISRSLALQGERWAYLSDGGAGVSILDVRDPAGPQLVDRLTSPGVVTAVTVSANRLYVASRPQDRVRIYEITDERSPVLLGEVQVGGMVEAMRAGGDLLHVALLAGPGWQGCLSGRYCPRGTQVEVYDVSEPAAVALVGAYDGEDDPAVHIQTARDLGIVRTYDGFTVYRLEALP